MPDYKVVEVRTRRDLRRFIRFPDELYRNCPQYVPALHGDQARSLTRSASLRYCRRKMWLVLDGKKVAGRICAMVNPRYNELYGTERARFGWFDVVEDFEAARLLLETAEAWAAGQGMTEIHGPLYYNTLGKQGMLVEGFGNIPPFNCLYNYPYYNDFVVRMGYAGEVDWLQYAMPADRGTTEKMERLAALLKERYGLREGSVDALKRDPEQVRNFFRSYNETFADAVRNFIPFTDGEVEEEAKSVMRFLSDRTSTVILDGQDRLAAFGICFPSISKALQKAKGRLFPLGWYYLLRALRRNDTADLMLTGTVPAWQNKGVSSLIHASVAGKMRKAGIVRAITNPQLESNATAVNVWAKYESELYMRRRCYVKKIEK